MTELMTKKALFLDIDGTLVTDDKQIPPENGGALEKALEKGHCVVISTGRPLFSAVALARELGLTGKGSYLIAFNGGILYDTYNNKVIFKLPVPMDCVRILFREAEKRGIHIQTYDSEKVVVEKRCDDEDTKLYCRKIRMDYRVIDSIDNLEEEPVKLLAINTSDIKPLEDFKAWIEQNMGDRISAFFSNFQYLEIVCKGLNKGNALRQMAQVLGVPVKDTIAAGDQANDIDMIAAAGTGCAMANGTDEIKKVADYVTQRDNNHAGVAEIIERFVL